MNAGSCARPAWLLILAALAAWSAQPLAPLAAQEAAPQAEKAEGESHEKAESEPHGQDQKAESHEKAGSEGHEKGGGEDHAKGGDAHGEGHEGGGHDEHDPYEIGERNATPKTGALDGQENPAEWRYELALVTLVVFLILLAALMKFAWKPIVTGLDQRESSIAKMIDEAKANHAAAEKRLQEYEAKLTAAANEAQAIVAQARQDAQSTADRIKAEAEEAANRQRERALSDIETAKTAALGEIAEKSVDAAMGLAGAIVQRQLSRQDHEQLIREAMEKFPRSP